MVMCLDLRTLWLLRDFYVFHERFCEKSQNLENFSISATMTNRLFNNFFFDKLHINPKGPTGFVQ